MIRRPFALAIVASVVACAASAPGASAISVDCTTQPANPVGYELSATQADKVATPALAPSIAVLDTGIADVPELHGRIDPGFNVATGGVNTNDIDGHGTAVASVAAAAAGGVRGVSPSSHVVPIKIYDAAGNSSADDFVVGMQRAITARAGVINISSTADGFVDQDTVRAMQEAVNSAVSLGVPVVAASGNEGNPGLDLPARLAHVIAVGATDEAGNAAAYSNTGQGLDLVTPGSNLVTAAPSVICGSGYAKVTGTSFSAPLVAGTAALLLQKHPNLDVSQVTDMLRLHGPRSQAPAWSEPLGFGMLNVVDALDAPVPTADLPEVNDTIKWANLEPAVLAAPKRKLTIFPRISPHQDPSDVYRLKLRRGDNLQVRIQQPSGTALKLSFGAKALSPRRGTRFAVGIKRAGTYYVGVTIARSPAAGTGYALTLSR